MRKFIRSIGGIWLKEVDARRYAWVRIAFGVAVFLDVLSLWQYRVGLFSSAGVVGAAAAVETNPGIYFSVFRWLESPFSVTAIFIIAASASLLLVAGVWSRAMLAIVVYFFVSISQRAAISTTGWDMVLMNWGFILLFSPLGANWGIGRLLAERKTPLGTGGEVSPRYGLVLIQFQVAMIYWQAVVLRWGDPFWRDGEFLTYYLLSHHGRFGPEWVLAWHDTLKTLTDLTMLVEFSLPFILWISGVRLIGICVGICFHVGVAIVSVNVTLFSAIMILTYTAFLGGGEKFTGTPKSINPSP